QHRRRERCRGRVVSHLLEEHRDLHRAEAEPTPVLGDRHTGPALLEHRAPQLGVDPTARLDDHPHPRGRPEVVEQLAGARAQGLLVVAEREIQAAHPTPAVRCAGPALTNPTAPHPARASYAERDPRTRSTAVQDEKPAYLHHGDTELELP